MDDRRTRGLRSVRISDTALDYVWAAARLTQRSKTHTVNAPGKSTTLKGTTGSPPNSWRPTPLAVTCRRENPRGGELPAREAARRRGGLQQHRRRSDDDLQPPPSPLPHQP